MVICVGRLLSTFSQRSEQIVCVCAEPKQFFRYQLFADPIMGACIWCTYTLLLTMHTTSYTEFFMAHKSCVRQSNDAINALPNNLAQLVWWNPRLDSELQFKLKCAERNPMGGRRGGWLKGKEKLFSFASTASLKSRLFNRLLPALA